MRFSFLSFIMFACTVLLVVKVADIIERRQSIEALIFETATAQEEGGGEGEESKGEEETTTAQEEGADAIQTDRPDEVITPEFSETEIDILQRLSKRREKLEEWESNLQVKENVLDITQTKINQKLDELRTLKKEVQGLLDEYNRKDEEKITSLIKIYENMKPKDAAEIFAELDMKTLLLVASKMKEKKVALVIAQMDPKLAKELTIRITEQRKLKEPEKDKM